VLQLWRSGSLLFSRVGDGGTGVPLARWGYARFGDSGWTKRVRSINNNQGQIAGISMTDSTPTATAGFSYIPSLSMGKRPEVDVMYECHSLLTVSFFLARNSRWIAGFLKETTFKINTL
jgi:hypothetical protein